MDCVHPCCFFQTVSQNKYRSCQFMRRRSSVHNNCSPSQRGILQSVTSSVYIYKKHRDAIVTSFSEGNYCPPLKEHRKSFKRNTYCVTLTFFKDFVDINRKWNEMFMCFHFPDIGRCLRRRNFIISYLFFS